MTPWLCINDWQHTVTDTDTVDISKSETVVFCVDESVFQIYFAFAFIFQFGIPQARTFDFLRLRKHAYLRCPHVLMSHVVFWLLFSSPLTSTFIKIVFFTANWRVFNQIPNVSFETDNFALQATFIISSGVIILSTLAQNINLMHVHPLFTRELQRPRAASSWVVGS